MLTDVDCMLGNWAAALRDQRRRRSQCQDPSRARNPRWGGGGLKKALLADSLKSAGDGDLADIGNADLLHSSGSRMGGKVFRADT